MNRRGIQLPSVFRFLDEAGVQGKTAEAHLLLGNEEQMTLRAGGPGIHSWPASGPYESLEVLMAGDPPRFWSRYGDSGGVVFARVPKLLITHHVARSGGMADVEMETTVREPRKTLTVRMSVLESTHGSLMMVLESMKGVDVISTRFSPV